MRFCTLLVLISALATSASGSLILDSENPVAGSGLGAVATILTMASPGSSTTESGCVVAVGSIAAVSESGTACTDTNTTVATGDDVTYANNVVQTGAGQIGVPTLASVGITSASDIRIFFNAVEPSGNPITLTGITITLYGATTGTTFTADWNEVQHVFPVTFAGTGNTFGYVFRLDATQAAIAQTFITANGAANVRVGLGASAADATGGHETFFLFNGGGGPPAAIPEPVSMIMLGSGLLAIALYRKKVRT